MKTNAFDMLQHIGKSLMLPISVLPIAGILLGVGSAHFSFMPTFLSEIFASSGGAVFSNLALLFAVGVALGQSKNDGVASLSAIVGFVVMNATLGVMAKVIFGLPTKKVMGIDTIETGVFGGIIIGLVAGNLFNRFYKIRLPDYLAFFSGKRFVPIITAFSAVFVGALLSYFWPPVQHGINLFSNFAVNHNPALMAFVYGVGERALIPFGLHHIWNIPFFFEIGSFVNSTGEVVHGDITRFFAGDKTAGFLGGAFLFKMFGLPCAAMAIWSTAKDHKKKIIGGVMISAALTSFLTGITEPIEFSFLFVAPLLYALHALFSGASFLIFSLLGVKLGTTFSHGLIDYVLYFGLNTKPLYLLIFGPLYGALYYFSFRFLILKFNLKTPGREDEVAAENVESEMTSLPKLILESLGGSFNIINLDACITRLRITVKDITKVNQERLKTLGAKGVVVFGNSLQVIFGTESDLIKTEILEMMNKEFDFSSPMSGEVMDLSLVPDKVFSQKMAGEGLAINPTSGKVVSPFDGEVMTIFPTKHALALKNNNGLEVLIHLGIDTVKLNGEGINCHVEAGQKVNKGDTLLTFNVEELRLKVPSLITPIIFPNLSTNKILQIMKKGQVQINERNLINFQEK